MAAKIVPMMLSAASAKIHQVAVAIDEGFDFVVDVLGGARMRHDEGILVGRSRLDPGGEAAVEREIGLVLVDDPREVAHGRGRELGLRDQQPLQPDRVEVFLGHRGRGRQHAGRHRLFGNGGVFPGDRLCRSIAFRVKPPRRAYCS